MAVAFDATSESHTGTTGSVSEASFSWTHTPSGTPKGVLIFVIQNNSSTDKITSVTYGGTTVPAVTGGLAAAATAEPRLCKAFFLGSGISTGAQTVVVNRTNDTTLLYAVAITVTAGADTEVYLPGIVLIQAVSALAEQSVDDGTTGVNSVRFAAVSSALNAAPGGGANSTGVNVIDFGTEVAQVVREVTAGQGSRSVGFSNATSDDVAAVHLAVRELGPVNGTATPSSVVGTGGVIGGVGYLDSYGDTYPSDVTAAFGGGTANPAAVVGTATIPAGTRPFSPSDIAGLKIWLKADAGAGAANNDPVATWTDQSGTSHSFAQATSGKRPLYKTNIQNGLPVVRFDGTDDVLTAGDLSASFPSAASVFASVIQTGGTGKLMVYATKNNDTWWRFTGGDGYWGVFRSTRISPAPASGLSGTGWHIWSHTGNGTAYKMWVDRGIQINAGSYTFDGGNSHLIGWQETNNEYPAMDLGELIVYDTALSDVDRAKVEDYLFARWAVLVAFAPTVAGVGAVPAATAVVSANGTATPSTTAGVGAVPAPTGIGLNNATPSAVAGTGGVPGPVVSVPATAAPARVVGTGAVPAATAFAASNATPAATAGVGLVPAATGSTVATISPSTVAGIGAVPGPNAIGAGSGTANPATVAGTGAVPSVTAFATSKATPNATVATGAVPASSARGLGFATASTVAGTGVVPGPITGGVIFGAATPSNVVGIGRVPRTIGMGAGTGGGGGTPDGATDFWTLTLAS